VKHLLEWITGFVLGFNWILGIVIAQGFWSVTVAVCFPPWAWYLVVENIAKHYIFI